MRSSPLFVSLFVVLALAVPAAAQTVTGDNVLAVYFDEGATQRSWYGTGPVTLYLIAGPLTRYDTHLGRRVPCTQLEGWYAPMNIIPIENVSNPILTPRGAGSPAPISLAGGHTDIDLMLPVPLPLAGRTVIADITMVVVSTAPTAIHLLPLAFRADGVLGWFEILRDEQGDDTSHVASLNAAAPVPAEPSSWGGIKRLYD